MISYKIGSKFYKPHYFEKIYIFQQFTIIRITIKTVALATAAVPEGYRSGARSPPWLCPRATAAGPEGLRGCARGLPQWGPIASAAVPEGYRSGAREPPRLCLRATAAGPEGHRGCA